MKKITTKKPEAPATADKSELREVLERLAEISTKPVAPSVVHVVQPSGPLIVEIERDADGRMKRLIIERDTTTH